MKAKVINLLEILKDIQRIDGGYYLSPGVESERKLMSSPYPLETLKNCTKSIFKGGRPKRIFVDNPENGYELWGITEVLKSSPGSSKWMSTKYTSNLKNYFVKKGWTLVARSGSGAIGTAAYVRESFEGKVISEDLLRLVPNEKVKPGFLYAFLASGIGYNLMQKGIYGTAIPHIEPDYAERVMVSLFPERQQKEIHDLIVTAANLRVEANELLNKAVSIFEKEIPNFESRKNYSSSFATRKKHNFRLDASFSAESLDKFYENLLDLGVRTKTIEELSGEVFTPNIFKRIRVNDPNYGIPFLSGSDLLKSKPKFDKFLSKRMENIDDYILKEGWIAIQDSGTIGYVSLISSWVDGCSATNNLVRIVPKSENFNYYIYPFLLSRPGQAILKCHEYGSVQKHIDNNQVKGIRVPILEEFQEEILEEIESMLKKQGVACDLEQRAINLVEKEIESWQ